MILYIKLACSEATFVSWSRELTVLVAQKKSYWSDTMKYLIGTFIKYYLTKTI